MCVCVCSITFDRNDVRPRYLVRRFTFFVISRSSSHVTVVCQRSESQEENVPFSAESESDIEKTSSAATGRKPGRKCEVQISINSFNAVDAASSESFAIYSASVTITTVDVKKF